MPYPKQPKDTPIPVQLDRWNWGAFLLNWIWGLGNSTYIALLMFVPVLNFVMIFVLGAKGSKWAWENRIWADEEHFVRTQRNWARAGVIVIVGVFLLFGSIFYGVAAIMRNSDAYKITMEQVRGDKRVVEALGKPIETGWFTSGNISLNGIEGHAELSIPVSGPKCEEGVVISRSIKKAGTWEIYLLVVRTTCQPSPVILINKNNIRIPDGALEA